MRVGLVGYGYWGGGFVARNIARVAELAVIADPDPKHQKKAAATWGAWGTRVVSEPSVVFEECEAVWIASPAATHAGLVTAALDAGCHVLCEKPFVLDPFDAAALAEQAARSGLALMTGHLSLYTGCHAACRRNLRGGQAVIKASRLTNRPSLSDHDVLHGLGPHDLAAIVDLLGEPDRVTCGGGQHRVTASLFYDAGHFATLEIDWCSSERKRRFWLNDHEHAETADPIEPLLAEVLAFVEICGNDGELRLAKREEAVSVAALTARLATEKNAMVPA